MSKNQNENKSFVISDIQQNEALEYLRQLYKKFQHDMQYINENVEEEERKEKGVRYNKSMMQKVTYVASIIKQIPTKKTEVDDCPF